MITVEQYVKELKRLIKENPEIKDFPVVYAIDDEGNSYHHVSNLPGLMEVENPNVYYLEPVFLEEDSDEYKPNVLIVN